MFVRRSSSYSDSRTEEEEIADATDAFLIATLGGEADSLLRILSKENRGGR